jgi:hypothetical protein
MASYGNNFFGLEDINDEAVTAIWNLENSQNKPDQLLTCSVKKNYFITPDIFE